jgi:hypothetical protein
MSFYDSSRLSDPIREVRPTRPAHPHVPTSANLYKEVGGTSRLDPPMSTSPLGERKRDFFDALGARLVSYGFVPQWSAQAFRRRYPWGRDSIHLAFIRGATRLRAAVDIATRFDAVEKLIDPFRPWIPDREKRNLFTLGAELGNVSGAGYREFEVEEDVRQTVDDMMVLIEGVGLPYLKLYSNPEFALEVVLRDDEVGRLHCPMEDDRAFVACALLVVLGRGHELSAVVERKMQEIDPNLGPLGREFPAFARAMLERVRH